LPATQLTHVAALVAAVAADDLPLAHGWHAVLLLWPFAVEYFPAVQLKHTVVPLTSENLPVGQASHRASEMVVAPGSVKKPALHVLEPLHAVSPAASVYLPDGQ
jgi:hypothetical protein